jgi:CheY-like chemotaxis protein
MTTPRRGGALCEMLSQLGAKAEQCASGREAITRLRDAQRGQHALVLVDRSLPDLTLPELIGALRASDIEPSRVIMMLRTTELTGDLADLRAVGLNAYLTKPIKLAELAAVMASVAGRASAPASPSISAAKRDAEVGLAHPARILIADDVAVNRTLIHDMLRNLPFAIEDAIDGEDAMAKVMTGNYDLVLMDMQMPVLDGYDAAAAIRKWEREQARARVPIIALTASVLEADIKRAVAAGCDVHLAKPFRRKELVQLLAELLRASQAPLPPEEDKGGKRAASCV